MYIRMYMCRGPVYSMPTAAAPTDHGRGPACKRAVLPFQRPAENDRLPDVIQNRDDGLGDEEPGGTARLH